LASTEIHAVNTVSGNQPRVRRIIEEAAQTFLNGTPVSIAAGDGGVKAWDGTTLANAIAGFSLEPGNNLAALGTQPQASVTPPQPLKFGSVPNEASAVNLAGPLFGDGRIGFEAAAVDTVFRGQVGPAQTVAATDVGLEYGMTKDSDNHWYVDKTKTGANAVVKVAKLDPANPSASPRGVYFTVLPAAAQVIV
jgi:hypothetical protein